MTPKPSIPYRPLIEGNPAWLCWLEFAAYVAVFAVVLIVGLR